MTVLCLREGSGPAPALREDEVAPGPVAVITGAASGIGRALAVAISREGARVVLADIVITHEEALEPLRRRFQRLEQAIRERKP